MLHPQSDLVNLGCEQECCSSPRGFDDTDTNVDKEVLHKLSYVALIPAKALSNSKALRSSGKSNISVEAGFSITKHPPMQAVSKTNKAVLTSNKVSRAI